MGLYDYLKGPCPTCGEEIGADSGDIQIKWFVNYLDPFKIYRPGDKFPKNIEDGEYYLGFWSYCCGDQRALFAIVKDSTFVGFKRGKTKEELEEEIKKNLGVEDDPKFVVRL